MRICILLLYVTYSTLVAGQSPCNLYSQKWIEAINDGSYTQQYTKSAIALSHDGALHDDPESLVKYQEDLQSFLGRIKATTTAHCSRASNVIYYEISKIQSYTDEEFTVLSIWSNGAKEFEMIARPEEGKDYTAELNSRRAEWIALCNKHNAQNLVEELYEPEAIYFNHKPVIVGTADIATTYSYMNRESYSLHLEPEGIQQVSSHLIFEIGQCSGSYNGKYTLVWRKDSSGEWKILFDSNI